MTKARFILAPVFFASFLIVGLRCFGASSEQVEKILGYQPTGTGLFFQVTSGGCTKTQDFHALVQRQNSQVTELTLIRDRPDPCYSFIPMGVRLKFSYESLGLTAGESFIVKNPNGIVQGWIWQTSDVNECLF